MPNTDPASVVWNDCCGPGHAHASKADSADCILLAIAELCNCKKAKRSASPAIVAQVAAFRVANGRPAASAPVQRSVLRASACESPPEKLMMDALRRTGFTEFDTERSAGILHQQYWVDTPSSRHRLDFAVLRRVRGHRIWLNVEVDGFAYHSSKDDIRRGRRRASARSRFGWIVLRYSADEVIEDAEFYALDVAGCMADLVDRLTAGRVA